MTHIGISALCLHFVHHFWELPTVCCLRQNDRVEYKLYLQLYTTTTKTVGRSQIEKGFLAAITALLKCLHHAGWIQTDTLRPKKHRNTLRDILHAREPRKTSDASLVPGRSLSRQDCGLWRTRQLRHWPGSRICRLLTFFAIFPANFTALTSSQFIYRRLFC